MEDKQKMEQKEQQELQQMIIELNLCDARFKEMQQQTTLIDQQLSELQILEKNIDELKNVQQDNEILSQVGQGIFLKSKIKNNEELFIDIGSKMVLKKSPEEAKEIIKKRLEQVMKVRNLIMRELNGLLLNIQFLEKQIQEKVNKSRNK